MDMSLSELPGSWWWTGRPGVLWFMGSQIVRHDWATELNWIFHCLYVPQLAYPFICQWTSRLLPCPGYCKHCCDEHWGTCVSFNSGFLGVYAQKWDCWVISCHLFLISSASIRSIPFLSFIVPIFAWNSPLIFLIFLKIYLVFPILLFSSISLHWPLRKAFLSLLAILWNSASTKYQIAVLGCSLKI